MKPRFRDSWYKPTLIRTLLLYIPRLGLFTFGDYPFSLSVIKQIFSGFLSDIFLRKLINTVWKTTRTVIWRSGSVLITWPGLHVTAIEIRISVFRSEFAATGSTYFTQRYISQTNVVGYRMPDLRYPNWSCLGIARYGTPGGAARGFNLWRCDPLIRGPSFINAPPH